MMEGIHESNPPKCVSATRRFFFGGSFTSACGGSPPAALGPSSTLAAGVNGGSLRFTAVGAGVTIGDADGGTEGVAERW